MSAYDCQPTTNHRRGVARILPLILITLSLACSLPGLGSQTPTPLSPTDIPATPTPPPVPLPPALVESDPPPGSVISLTGPITLYFNQPMDRASVEGALSGQPALSGSFDWLDDATLSFAPDTYLLPETTLTINIASSAQSQKGMALLEPVSVSYSTSGYLNLSQVLPEPESSDVDPTSAVVATFNRPVVPLGADPAGLPTAFSLEPPAPGRGEWINTSTYIFYPEPALVGGSRYTARINPDLKGVDGSPLESTQPWSFTTAAPRLVSLEPFDGSQGVPLDIAVTLTFNQPMDTASVAANFTLLDPSGGAVSLQSAWDDDFTTLVFTPTTRLRRNTSYTAVLLAEAQSLGGTPLGSQFQSTWQTVPALSIYGSDPPQGGIKSPYGGITLYLSSIVTSQKTEQYISFSPQVDNLHAYADPVEKVLRIFADFAPETAYSLTVSSDLTDMWGSTLGEAYVLDFRSAPLNPNLTTSFGLDILFLTPRDTSIPAQATNLYNLPLSVGSVPLSDFIYMLGPGGYDYRQTYLPRDQHTWQQPLEVEANRSQPVSIPLSPDRSPLVSGLYALRFNLDQQIGYAGPYLLVVSNLQTTFKLSASDALVWAVDLRTNAPVASAPVVVYDESGNVLASGQTDAEGVFKASIPTLKESYGIFYAVVGQSGDDLFGMALSNWNLGMGPWDFGITADYSPPGIEAYIYTDRPIYRPGQTVYFRVVVRQESNGRYTLPDRISYPLTLYDGMGSEITTFELPLSAYGTGHGAYTLLPDAEPGSYRLGSQDNSIWLDVADYRKPEINLQVSFTEEQILSGQALVATVNARYFFDAPAGDLPVRWALYTSSSYFSIPGGYQVGAEDTRWLEPFYYPVFGASLGILVSEGEATTNSDGLLTLELPPEPGDSRQKYTLEVTLQDESGLPVSARSSAQVNPAEFYIGVRPDAWSSQVGQQTGFEVLVVDWEGDPAGARTLQARWQKVVWVQQDPDPEDTFAVPTFVPQYTLAGSTDFTTAEDGTARIAFTPSEPGTYQLDVAGGGALTEVLLWVGGPGQATWPNLPNQRLRLTADRESYQPGDTAQVFIPNPFGARTLALVTVERGIVMRHQVVRLEQGGTSLPIPLSGEDAPNVYVAVTLLGDIVDGRPDFRQGYVELPVSPVEQQLNVTLTSQPERTGPGETVTFGIRVTDAAGDPVQGEFSLSVVDLAALALADPNAPDILTAFYSSQPLGVRTGSSLAAYAHRRTLSPGGLGGGGGDEATSVVREHFPDTAFWDAQVLTNANGEAQVSVTLPDSLTTWQVGLRGLTADTRVGEAEARVITTKDLLVRPVVPRFLVVDDHVQLAVIVQNNTASDLQTEVSLTATGFLLDDPNSAVQQVLAPAGGRARVEWWGTAQDIGSADLVFSARSGDLHDSARPALGALPVLHYSAPQSFATAGVLPEGGERLELVSLPATFDARGGELRLELAPSLAAAMLNALDALEQYPYDCTEQTLSRFLPNLEAYRALQAFGIESPDLQARLDRTLNEGLNRLLSRQNSDGGWGWWPGGESNPYLSAYILFGLTRAQASGISVPDQAFGRAVDYLIAGLYTPEMASQAWMLDRLVFVHYALTQAGAGDLGGASALYHVRDQLSPWAQALLALTLENLTPGNEQVGTLLSDLQGSAIRSATGVHWEEEQLNWANMHTTLSTSAVVVFALAQRQPASTLLPDAVRYLMVHRQASGGWASTYASAWTLLAITEFMKGTGELGGDFSFGATLNGAPFASGQAGADTQLNPTTTSIPVSNLYPDDPNALLIQRDPGPGRLYYNTALEVYRPVETVAPLDRGISLARSHYLRGDPCTRGSCSPTQSARAGDQVTVRVTLVLPNDAYYLIVEDYIPAGSEILNISLKTSQLGDFGEPEPLYDPNDPFAAGWGWWYFHAPQIYDDHIAWAADHLPAGTYELTYTLVILQPGEYRLLPARAWQFYFPDVQGTSAGMLFEIEP